MLATVLLSFVVVALLVVVGPCVLIQARSCGIGDVPIADNSISGRWYGSGRFALSYSAWISLTWPLVVFEVGDKGCTMRVRFTKSQRALRYGYSVAVFPTRTIFGGRGLGISIGDELPMLFWHRRRDDIFNAFRAQGVVVRPDEQVISRFDT